MGVVVVSAAFSSSGMAAGGKETRVMVEMPGGLLAQGSYWAGAPDMPAVMIQHGFLQTHEFHTVRNLALALATTGFHVLTPTLTLGVDRRASSLPCEAVHAHNLDQTREEVRVWTDWLHAAAGRSPVLIGHSAGNMNLLAYLEDAPADHVAHAIFISVTFFGSGEVAFESPKHAERARVALDRGEQGLKELALGFCRQYTTTPAAYLSYYDWDRPRTEQALRTANVPSTLIAGGADNRIDLDWIETIQRHGAEVRVIDGANHFYDELHEFELMEEIEQVLRKHVAQ
nr:alpha/beta fold hydrolase [Thioalkalivibrio sp. ALJT]